MHLRKRRPSLPRRRGARPGNQALFLGLESDDLTALRQQVEEGLPFATFEELRSNLEMSTERLLTILDIPRRTLLRRREEGRFSADESDRLVRVSRVLAKAVLLFEGDRAAALAWLSSTRPALGNAAPFSLVRTEIGAREVETLVDRLEHGVFS